MEWLKDILGEELYNQVKPKLDEKGVKIANLSDGNYLPRDKFNEKNEENKILKEQIEDLKKKEKEIDKLVSSNQDLKNQVDTINKDYSDKLAEKDTQISNMAKTNAINSVLQEHKAEYPDMILKTLNLADIEMKDGKLENFNIEKIKEQYPKMFETVQTQGNVNPANNNPLTQGGNPSRKQQLINEYNKAEETRDIAKMMSIQKQIQSLNE